VLDIKLNSLIDSQRFSLPGESLRALLSGGDQFVFIKNSLSVYCYANSHFIELMGCRKLHDIYNQTDAVLCRDKAKIKVYQQHDDEVLDSGKALSIAAEVAPVNHRFLRKQMIGKLYPIFSDSCHPVAVLGLVKPRFQRFKLTLDDVVSLSTEEIDKMLLRRSYEVLVYNQNTTLSKREIQCIIELLKGKHAGEIADILLLKQTTVEFYLENIKNKLGADSKSSLIGTVFNQKIIQQIIL